MADEREWFEITRIDTAVEGICAEDENTGEPTSSALSLIAGLSDPFDVEEQWQDRALCAQTDPEAFFPPRRVDRRGRPSGSAWGAR